MRNIMKHTKLKITFTTLTLFLNIAIYAQGPPGGGQGGGKGQRGGKGEQKDEKPDASEILYQLDLNKDKVIDKDEAAEDKRGKIAEDFDQIDSNSDGVIDLDELKASLENGIPVSAEKIIKEIDDNGDGTLNELEVAAKDNRQLITNFNTIDTNKDNVLDLEELKTFYAKHKEQPKQRKRN